MLERVHYKVIISCVYRTTATLYKTNALNRGCLETEEETNVV